MHGHMNVKLNVENRYKAKGTSYGSQRYQLRQLKVPATAAKGTSYGN